MFVWQAQLVGYWYVQDDVSPELSCMISVVDGTQEVGGQGEEGGSMAGKGESGWTFEEDRDVGKSKGNRKGKGRGRAPAAAAAKTRQDGTLETPGDCQEGRPCAVKDEGEEVEGKKARALSVEEKKRRALAEAKEIDRLALEIEALRTEVLTAGGIGKAGKAGKKEKRGKGRTRAREGQGRMAEVRLRLPDLCLCCDCEMYMRMSVVAT